MIQINKKSIKDYKKLIDKRVKYNKKKSLNVQEIDFQQMKYADSIISQEIGSGERITLNKMTFRNCRFNECTFEHITFSHCTFINCDFISCDFKNTHFVECSIIPGTYLPYINVIKEKQLEYYISLACYFDDTKFNYVTFERCSMTGAVFNRSSILQVNFDNSDMECTFFYSCAFSCRFINSKLDGATFLETDFFLVKFDEYDNSGFDRNTIFHCSDVRTEPKSDKSRRFYGHRSYTYLQISDIFQRSGLADLYGEYYYLAKKYEQKSLTKISAVSSLLTDILCGYGERPSHTFFFILGNILLFGLFYLFSGFAHDSDLINTSVVRSVWPNITEVLKLFCQSVFFSVTTFSTVGYGNYVPVGGISSTLAAIQMLMGVSLTALWTGCIFRKISR